MAAMLDLRFLADPYAVCWLEATAPIPAWVEGEGFLSILRAEDDLTVACRQSRVPPEVRAERDWCCPRLSGPFVSGLTGILAAPLAQAGEGIFAVSTYSTDYLLVKTHHLAWALAALGQAGHRVHNAEVPCQKE